MHSVYCCLSSIKLEAKKLLKQALKDTEVVHTEMSAIYHAVLLWVDELKKILWSKYQFGFSPFLPGFLAELPTLPEQQDQLQLGV